LGPDTLEITVIYACTCYIRYIRGILWPNIRLGTTLVVGKAGSAHFRS
jgi:hypothetical protein